MMNYWVLKLRKFLKIIKYEKNGNRKTQKGVVSSRIVKTRRPVYSYKCYTES